MHTVDDLLKEKQRDVVWIEPLESVFDALKLMNESNVGALCVQIDGYLVGVVSERDYVRKAVSSTDGILPSSREMEFTNAGGETTTVWAEIEPVIFEKEHIPRTSRQKQRQIAVCHQRLYRKLVKIGRVRCLAGVHQRQIQLSLNTASR